MCIKTQVLLYSTVILMRNKCRNRYFMILCVQITIGMCRGNKLVEVFRIRCAEVGGGESCLLLRLLNLNKCSLPLACRLFLAHFRDVKLFTFMSQHNTPLKILATWLCFVSSRLQAALLNKKMVAHKLAVKRF